MREGRGKALLLAVLPLYKLYIKIKILPWLTVISFFPYLNLLRILNKLNFIINLEVGVRASLTSLSPIFESVFLFSAVSVSEILRFLNFKMSYLD